MVAEFDTAVDRSWEQQALIGVSDASQHRQLFLY